MIHRVVAVVVVVSTQTSPTHTVYQCCKAHYFSRFHATDQAELGLVSGLLHPCSWPSSTLPPTPPDDEF
jgi:hypothetical protein